MNPEDVPEAVVDAHMAWLTQERGGEDTPFLRALARARLAATLPTHEEAVRKRITGELDKQQDMYPLDVFPEPDDNSGTADRISASACRLAYHNAARIARGNHP